MPLEGNNIIGGEHLVDKATCDKNTKFMGDKMDNLKDDMNEIKIHIAELPEKLAEKFDARYASKLTEKIIYGVVTLILTTVVGSMVYLVMKPSNETNKRIQVLENNFNEVFEKDN